MVFHSFNVCKPVLKASELELSIYLPDTKKSEWVKAGG
jgi:hypothetical protein